MVQRWIMMLFTKKSFFCRRHGSYGLTGDSEGSDPILRTAIDIIIWPPQVQMETRVLELPGGHNNLRNK